MGCHALIQIFLTQGWNSHLLQSPALAGRFCTTGTYKLNKQGDNIQPYPTPFPILNQSVIPCKVLTVVPWPSYKFLRRQVRWSGIPISLRIFHHFLWSTQRLCIVNEGKVDVFLKFSCSMIQWMLPIWSLILLPFLNPAGTFGSSWFLYYWSLAWKILSITLLACDMSPIVQ